MSALAPALILEAVEAMSGVERARLAELLSVTGPVVAPAGPAELLTVREAAAIAGVCEETIRRKVKTRELPDRRIGGRIRVAVDDLAALLEPSRTAVPAPPSRRRRHAHPAGGGAMAEAFAKLSR